MSRVNPGCRVGRVGRVNTRHPAKPVVSVGGTSGAGWYPGDCGKPLRTVVRQGSGGSGAPYPPNGGCQASTRHPVRWARAGNTSETYHDSLNISQWAPERVGIAPAPPVSLRRTVAPGGASRGVSRIIIAYPASENPCNDWTLSGMGIRWG